MSKYGTLARVPRKKKKTNGEEGLCGLKDKDEDEEGGKEKRMSEGEGVYMGCQLGGWTGLDQGLSSVTERKTRRRRGRIRQ